jgi:hypothetical protein
VKTTIDKETDTLEPVRERSAIEELLMPQIRRIVHPGTFELRQLLHRREGRPGDGEPAEAEAPLPRR